MLARPRALVGALLGTGLCALGGVTTTGCVSEAADDDVGTSSASALALANGDFDAELRALQSMTQKCATHGRCTSDGALRPAAATHTLGVTFPRITMCDAVRPLAAFENPYVFAGASARSGVLRTRDAGVDVVFDLARRQVATFTYSNRGVQNLVGVEANTYFGYAFGKKKNVLDAWSGEFQTSEATVATPFLKLSAGGAIFRSPDNSVWGAMVEVAVGLNALGPLSTTELAVNDGEWTAWDKGTEALGEFYWHVAYTPTKAAVGSERHIYLQFAKGRDQAFALVQTLGPLGLAPAAQALALEAMQSRGLSFSKACDR